MLLADCTITEDSPEQLPGRGLDRSTGDNDGSTIETAELLDLLDLLREDARIGPAMLDRELRKLAGEAASLERAVAELGEAGHNLATHAASQAAAAPRLRMLRRLLDQHVATLASTLEAASITEESRAAALAETKAFGDAMADGLGEIETVLTPSSRYTDALAKVIGTSQMGRGAEAGIAPGIEASRQKLGQLGSRLLLALRLPCAQERRRAPRQPVRIAAALQCGDRRWVGETVDLAQGGALVAVETSFDRPPVGGSAKLDLAELGVFPVRIVGLSAKGVHLAFDGLTAAQRGILDGRLAALAALDAPFFNLARWAAREVEAGFARGVAASEIAETALFVSPASLLATADADAAAAPAETGLAEAARDFLCRRLAPLQAQIAASRGEIVYATCSDRHGYLAVVTAGPAASAAIADVADDVPAILGLSGKLDESENGIIAARNRQPQLVVSPRRHLREVAVPITIDGRHWGAFRLGFSTAEEARPKRGSR